MPPGELVTLPWPEPVFETESRFWVLAKLAVACCAWVIVTWQVAPEGELQPVQPAKVELESGWAVRATWVPPSKVCEQVEPQSMPPDQQMTWPKPLPDIETEGV